MFKLVYSVARKSYVYTCVWVVRRSYVYTSIYGRKEELCLHLCIGS